MGPLVANLFRNLHRNSFHDVGGAPLNTAMYSPCDSISIRVSEHHNHCTVNVFSPGCTHALKDESRRAVFKCVSVNIVWPV